MRHPRIWGGALAVALLGGGGLTFVVLRAQRERDQQVETMLRNVASELATNPLDRTSATTVLRRLDKMLETEPRRELERARTRLLMALGRPNEAWDAVSTLATTPGAATEDLALGAQVMCAVHAARGTETDGVLAMGLAEQHYRETGELASLSLAWQMAYRATQVPEWVSLYK